MELTEQQIQQFRFRGLTFKTIGIQVVVTSKYNTNKTYNKPYGSTRQH